MRRADRLRAGSGFKRLYASGRRVTRPEFVLYHAPRDAPGRSRVGFSVPRSIGGAVVRNRTKRLLREAVRPLIPRLVACDMVVAARPPAAHARVGDLEAAFAAAAAEAGLIRTEGTGAGGSGDTPT